VKLKAQAAAATRLRQANYLTVIHSGFDGAVQTTLPLSS